MLTARANVNHALAAELEAEKDYLMGVTHVLDAHPPRAKVAFTRGSLGHVSVETLSSDRTLQAALVATPVVPMDSASSPGASPAGGIHDRHRLRRALPPQLAHPRDPVGLSSRCASWCVGVPPAPYLPSPRSPVADLAVVRSREREHTEDRLVFLRQWEKPRTLGLVTKNGGPSFTGRHYAPTDLL